MRKRSAAIGSTIFFILGPGTVAGLVPWLITGWESTDMPGWWWALRGLGAMCVLVGVAVIVHAFYRFVVEGLGTPVPAAPPSHLVVGGLFRHVRNPMYVALALMTGGQTLLFASWPLAIYFAVAWACTAAFVKIYEEPKLTDLFGDEYRTYKRHVPAWIPRVRPWTPTAV